MSLPPPGSPRRDVAAQVRRDARDRAEGWSGAWLAIGGIGVVLFLMVAFIFLDYNLDQDPHRILKVALGLFALGGIVARPAFGLLLLPVITPFLGWVPPTPIPGLNALNVLLFAVFGSYAFGAVMARRPFMRSGRLRGVIGVLVGLAVLSILRGAVLPTGYGYDPLFAALNLFRSGMTFVLYFILLSMVRGEKPRRHVAWAVLAGLLAESLVTMKLGRSGGGARAIGSIGQSNELGAYLALFTVLAAAVAVGARSWMAKLCGLGIMVAGTFGIMLSLSRGSMLALVGGLVVVAWRSSRWVFGVMIVVMALAPLWLPDYVMTRITESSVESDAEDGVSVDASSELRLMTWRAIMEVVSHHPIDGVGFTGLQYVLPDMGAAMGLENVKDSAHNTYLRMLSEMGVLGLGAFLWLLWSVWRLADDGVRLARTRFDRCLSIGLGGAVVAMAISCAFGDRFWSPVVASSFWILAALVEDVTLDQPPAVPAAPRAGEAVTA